VTSPGCWVFDVDGTLVDAMSASSLRPGAREILAHLRNVAAQVIWWSAGGEDYARRMAVALGVSDLVDEFHTKGGRGSDGRYLTDHFLPAVSSPIFVDDSPSDLPLGAHHIAVFPYIAPNVHDRGLVPVARAAGLTPPAEDAGRSQA
jgi:phosphoglycolate phosphatase-like HAD superfamily hydrolase